jgi:hypothetical protein
MGNAARADDAVHLCPSVHCVDMVLVCAPLTLIKA